MLQKEIQTRLNNEFSEAEIAVEVSGNHAHIVVISKEFEGVSKVKRQQRIYACLNDLIRSGQLHAVVIEANPSSDS